MRYTPLVIDPPQWKLRKTTIKCIETRAENLPDSMFAQTGESDVAEKADISTCTDNSYSVPHESSAVSVATTKVVNKSENDAFNGFFQPHCGDTIILSRIGSGSLSILVESTHRPIINVTSEHKGSLNIPAKVRSLVMSIDASAVDGVEPALVWPMEGRIDPSRQIKAQVGGQYGVLLNGKVEVMAGRIGSDSKFPVDSHSLEPGDHLVLPTSTDLDQLAAKIASELAGMDGDQGSRSEREQIMKLCSTYEANSSDGQLDKGFVLAGALSPAGLPRALHVALSSNAQHVDIKRYRTANLQVRSSWFKRLVNDPIIAFGWTVIGVVFVLYRKIVRLLVIYTGESDSHGRNQDGI